MGSQNRYCTRCGKTTRFKTDGVHFTCSGCGTCTEVSRQRDAGRSLVGDPFSFRIRFV